MQPMQDMLPPIDGKIYMVPKVSWCGFILVLNVTAASIPVLPLPDTVTTANIRIAGGEDDSGLFLVHAEGHLISVWFHWTKGISAAAGDGWVSLVDKVQVREAYSRGEDVSLIAVSEGAEFALLGLK